jgi:23S rRNA pseudouridine2605 synthase
MRINRYLARAGVVSRRGADRLVRAGRVTINDRTAEPGARVRLGDIIRLDGREVELPPEHTYLILNKPPGYVVTLSDPQGRPTVVDLVDGVGAGIVPVGRLDAPTEGLLIMTNDGVLAHRIAHPSFELDKVYEARIEGDLTDAEVETLESGIMLDGRMTSPARVRVLSREGRATLVEITIHEGRKRQVRRMFLAVDHAVQRLRRTRVGPLELGNLGTGAWRRITEAELLSLREALGMDEA